MNLGDPELEFIDPTPNVHNLFIHFDKLFFWTKLCRRAVVRWSKRMYTCAGVCTYEGSGGLCVIALSEPLLKLRPRKDLVETLLHEMIHAFLFVASRDRDRDGHGPNFKAHMYRINQVAGINITIYHDFHEEVELYQTHWWRCNGPCQNQRPHFGIVRHTTNRAPGPWEYWWSDHMRKCNGTFMKIKEPEKKAKKAMGKPKPNADITKYIDNKRPVNNNVPPNDQRLISVLKDSNTSKTVTKSNGSNTLVVTKGVIFNPQVNKPTTPVFSGKGQSINGVGNGHYSSDITETVRNVWANKQLKNLPLVNIQSTGKSKQTINSTNQTTRVIKPKKHKTQSVPADSPPVKVKKIDDYFKTAATLLKDVYGKDFNVTQSKNKLVASVATATDLVDCPICSTKVSSTEINRHIDECLNKDVLEKLCEDTEVKLINHQPMLNTVAPVAVDSSSKYGNGVLLPISAYKERPEYDNTKPIKHENHNVKTTPELSMDVSNLNHTTNIVFAVPKEEKTHNDDFLYLPSFYSKIDVLKVKIEPGTSKDLVSVIKSQKCACCGELVDKPIKEHLDECLAFFDKNTTVPKEGASTSFANQTIVIDDDDDILDESLTFNATGTKVPCPCCLHMTEEANMNEHLDECLN